MASLGDAEIVYNPENRFRNHIFRHFLSEVSKLVMQCLRDGYDHDSVDLRESFSRDGIKFWNMPSGWQMFAAPVNGGDIFQSS